VVDGPAAGHAITFLTAAAGLRDAVRSGPIRVQADDVAELLQDPIRCQVVLVTLPETTPVNEVVETAYALEDRVGVQLGPLVVNGVDATAVEVPDAEAVLAAGDPDRELLVEAADFRRARLALQRNEIERLRRELALDQWHLPLLPVAGLGVREVVELAGALRVAT